LRVIGGYDPYIRGPPMTLKLGGGPRSNASPIPKVGEALKSKPSPIPKVGEALKSKGFPYLYIKNHGGSPFVFFLLLVRHNLARDLTTHEL